MAPNGLKRAKSIDASLEMPIASDLGTTLLSQRAAVPDPLRAPKSATKGRKNCHFVRFCGARIPKPAEVSQPGR